MEQLYGVAAGFANALILASLIGIFDGQRDSVLGRSGGPHQAFSHEVIEGITDGPDRKQAAGDPCTAPIKCMGRVPAPKAGP